MRDPYEVLDVSRDATEAEIKAAGKRAAKRAHPDAGGSADKFAETRNALAILTDPKKRERFDRTGKIDDNKPDTATAQAMQIIEVEMGKLADAFVTQNIDPCGRDCLEEIKLAIRRSIAQGNETIRTGKRHREMLARFAKRWQKKTSAKKSKLGDFDFLARRFKDQIANIEEQLAQVEGSISNHKLALELIEEYAFERDPAAVASPYVYSGRYA